MESVVGFKFDVEDILKILDSIDDNRMNAMMYGSTCVYTDQFGNHCIAGEILDKLGLPVPDFSSSLNDVGFGVLLLEDEYYGIFSAEAADMISRGQETADMHSKNKNSQAWLYAKDDMRNWIETYYDDQEEF